ncbi:MAG: nucleotide-binding protein [Anaerolineae bacterium]|jgi:predicted nucleotide-binding protein|nr:nucleotide-binding protein [Anaerolineae bacterium]MBT3714474.1 nucleotide-binding protein [Anaerolineae bacterium]MBT4311638.1 nucleotide-binding protein [Anaerolineae bacterium]MBT4459817.1 nucleotide-binding protein [Anaerolineae bacterium]MBT4843130.1 nucleotide-binding protein [Anaerolineae bacterium]
MDVLREKAYLRLKELRQEVDRIAKLGQRSKEFKVWERNTATALNKLFGQESQTSTDFGNIGYLSLYSTGETEHRYFLEQLESAKAIVDSAIQEIEDYEIDIIANKKTEPTREGNPSNNQVFIVHGHDNESKETIARFLEKLELTPIILHEQPDGGQTIIEKFERNSDVDFAIALLTPDDIGALAGETKDFKPRARQNVIFELGFFVGKLGRAKICAMTKENVEILSDYSGVVYISLDDNSWKIKLLRELKAAGFNVDANQIV